MEAKLSMPDLRSVINWQIWIGVCADAHKRVSECILERN